MTKTDILPWVRKVSDDVVRFGRGKAPGKIATTIGVTKSRATAYKAKVTVEATAPYSLFPEEGTGIYGPKGGRIYPKTAKVLVFRPRGSSQLVFAKSVKGQKAQHYMEKSLIAAIAKNT